MWYNVGMKAGIIAINKESGMTSHDVVARLRRLLKEKKIGHAGTLDPDVTGVLPIAVGKATRLIEYMQESGKVYRGRVMLGVSTTTEDASGDVVEKVLVSGVTEAMIDEAMVSFIGEIRQVPPMYSAVRVNGRHLYEYARSGETVERPSRVVTIYDFRRLGPMTSQNGTVWFDFEVVCSKGTYVRTLSVDLGEKLGFPAHMSMLVRQSAAGMDLEESLTLGELEDLVSASDWSFLKPLESGLGNLKQVMIGEANRDAIGYGRAIQIETTDDYVAALYEGKLVAILEKRGNWYKPHKVFL